MPRLGIGLGIGGRRGRARTAATPGVLLASTSYIAVTGQDASLRIARVLTAAQGSVAVSGQAANLMRSALTLAAATGNITVTGENMTPLIDFKLPADQASIAVSAQDAILRVARSLVAAQGSIAVSGQNATLTIGGGASLTVTYRGNTSDESFSGPLTKSIDIGTASAGRLVVVGLACSQPADGSNDFTAVTVNGVSLTRRITQNGDRHCSLWSGIVASGSGAQDVVVTYTGMAFSPKYIHLWTLTGFVSSTHKATAGATSSSPASMGVDAGDAVLSVAYVNNANFSLNSLSSELFTTHRDDNGSPFTNYGPLSIAGELIAATTNASWTLRLAYDAVAPGVAQSGEKAMISFR